ncbi:MAG: phage major capsid protein [Synechococcaceae cyanobacterium]|nr:phage major capsid protein [Synechococcaceae cyanobacterium]
MGINGLISADDLRRLPYGDKITGLTFAAVLNASASDRYDVPVWRALSNLIGEEWIDEKGLPSPHSWWAPRRKDARALAGSRGLTTGAAFDTVIGSAVGAIAAAVRPRTALEQAGARRVEVGAVADHVQPEWKAGAGAWVGEGGAVPAASTLGVGTGNGRPKTAGAQIEVSRKLLKQTELLEAEVSAEMTRIVRGVVEAGAFNGSGVEDEPLGLLQTPNATGVSLAGSVPTYAEVADCVDAYYASDADPLAAAWFVNPADFAKLTEVEKVSGSGKYAASIEAGVPYIKGIRAWPTSHIPAGKVILTNPQNVSLVYWRAAQLIRNPFALDTSGGLRLTVLNDVDVVVQHRAQLIIGSAA